MLTLLRPLMALCTLMLLGLTVPAGALKPSLTTADRQVCCSGNDAAGNLIFFYAPASQCPRDKVVALERCKPRQVCCKTPNGFFPTMSDRCKAAGGSIVPDSYCKPKPVCCRTPNGVFQAPSADRCTAGGGTVVPDSYCRRPVCCRIPGAAPAMLLPARCKAAGGTVVSPRYCQPQKICCKYTKADGTVGYSFLDPRRCKAVRGSQVSNRYCLAVRPVLKSPN